MSKITRRQAIGTAAISATGMVLGGTALSAAAQSATLLLPLPASMLHSLCGSILQISPACLND